MGRYMPNYTWRHTGPKPEKKGVVSRVRGSKYRRCTEIRSKVRVIFLMKINQSAQLTKSNRSPATGRPSRLFGGEWGPKS